MPKTARATAGAGRSWKPVVNQRVRLVKSQERANWEDRAMTVTVTSVNKERQTFNAEGIGSGGPMVGRHKGFRLLGVCFSQIEQLLDSVKRTRGVGDTSMIKKRRRRLRSVPAAAAGAAAAQAAPAAAPAQPTTVSAAMAATPTTVAAKAEFLRTELNFPVHYTIAQVMVEAEKQLGLTPMPGDKVGQRLDKAYQELDY